MASNNQFKFDKFDHKKAPSEMTKWDVIMDFIIFIGISAGYVIRVGVYWNTIEYFVCEKDFLLKKLKN